MSKSNLKKMSKKTEVTVKSWLKNELKEIRKSIDKLTEVHFNKQTNRMKNKKNSESQYWGFY